MRYPHDFRFTRTIDDQDFEQRAYLLGGDVPSLDAYEYIIATSEGSRQSEWDIALDDEDSDEAAEFGELDAILHCADWLLSEIEAPRLDGPAF